MKRISKLLSLALALMMPLTLMAPAMAEAPATEPVAEPTIETIVIPAAEENGIPAHEIPATVTIPAGEGPFPAVVILPGTGNDRKAFGLFTMLAAELAERGIASIAIDFMGLGESTAEHIYFSYSSCNIDAKAAADYMAGLDIIDGEKIGVLGWSQGGTNAMMAAAAYPETFKAVVTWAGAIRLGGLFEDYKASYEAAKTVGYAEEKFYWRSSLNVGVRWFDDLEATDELAVMATIQAPLFALNGTADAMVSPKTMIEICKTVPNAIPWVIEGADHTMNVFNEDRTTVNKVMADTASFFEGQFYFIGK